VCKPGHFIFQAVVSGLESLPALSAPKSMIMKKGYILIICLGVASLLLGADVNQKKSKEARLSKMKLEDVATGDGFEYFSGHLDTKEIRSNFLTIYLFKDMGDVPKLRIIGKDVSVDLPVSRIDHALESYKILVLRKVAADQKERDRLSKEADR
jgi:hypothetical protein